MKKPKLSKTAQRLLGGIEESHEVRFKLECHVCGFEDEIVVGDDSPPTQTVRTLEQAAQAFAKEGWREGECEEFQLIGDICPKCWRTRKDLKPT